MTRVVILRPQPGADATADRARALGLDPVVAPLFTIRPLAWDAPDPAGFDAVMVTSANAVRHAGDGLTPFLALPCYTVGGRSAAAARTAGFSDIRIGPGNGGSLLEMMAADKIGRAFHPCGREVIAYSHPAVAVTRRPVYASDVAGRLTDEATQAITAGAVVLLHSPGAAAAFGHLIGKARGRIRIVAISPAAASAAGPGWQAVEAAPVPRDQALLELAGKLCQTDLG